MADPNMRQTLKTIRDNPELVVLVKLSEDPDLLARLKKIEAEADRQGYDLTDFYQTLVRAYEVGRRTGYRPADAHS